MEQQTVDKTFGGLVRQPDPDKLRQKLREQCADSLYFLGKSILGFRDQTASLHLSVCAFIQASYQRKLLIMPRGHFKSTILSIMYPIWRLLPKHPDWKDDPTDGPNSRILLSNSTATNAEHFLRRIKAVFESNTLFQWIYPELIPEWKRVKKWTETEIQLPRARDYPEASIETIGVGGRVTSRHYTDIIKDDLIEESIADNPEELKKVVRWHEYSESLLEQIERDRDSICGTRYNEYDLYGYIKDKDPRYKVYERVNIEEGKPIFSERFSLEQYADMQRRKPYIYACQYQNNPISQDIVDFKAGWLRYYRLEKGKIVLPNGKIIDPRNLNTYISVDPAISENKDAARTAIVNVGCYDNDHIFVLNAFAKRMNPHETIMTVFGMAKLLQPIKVGIEEVAYQKAF